MMVLDHLPDWWIVVIPAVIVILPYTVFMILDVIHDERKRKSRGE